MEASEKSVTDYFLYVKNVLGVKTLQSEDLRLKSQDVEQVSGESGAEAHFHQAQSPAEAAANVEEADIVFLNIRTSKANAATEAEAKDLAGKMIQAMRLGSRKVLMKNVDAVSTNAVAILQNALHEVRAPIIVLFSSKPGEQGIVKNLGATKYIETFGPEYLLNHPQAKKVAWMDLQKVMKEMGIV